MKKFLLSCFILLSVYASNAQVALNEVLINGGTSGSCTSANSSAFFELYNGSSTSVNLDCYAFVTYFQNKKGTGQNTYFERGFYVIDFPASAIIESRSVYVGAGKLNFCIGQSTQYPAQLNWNDPNITVRKYTANTATSTSVVASWSTSELVSRPIAESDLFDNAANTGDGASFTNSSFLFGNINGEMKLINGFFGGSSNQTTFYAELTTLPVMTGAGTCDGTPYNLSFAGVAFNQVEYVGASAGNANGYYRTSDGLCGSWAKSANNTDHTPGVNNSGTTPTSNYSVSLVNRTNCSNTTLSTTINFKFVYPAGENPYPLNYWVIRDVNNNSSIDASSIDSWSPVTTLNTRPTNDEQSVTLTVGGRYFIMARSVSGCFFATLTFFVFECQVTPVTLKSFEVRRTAKDKVALNWITASEENNSGFDIQRKDGNGEWKTVSFVMSQARGGNSDQTLSYQYTDNNSTTGISQYRLRQVDIDRRATLSEVRSVRGEEMAGNKVNVFPNPSQDGKVNLLFEDKNTIRTIMVSDMTGRIIKQYRAIRDNSLTIEGLENGMYNIHITDMTTSATNVEKVIIKKR